MTVGRRPGGLTALAVLNFLIGGYDCLATLGGLVNIAVERGLFEVPEQIKHDMAKAWEHTGIEMFYVLTPASALCAILLIASGVGYLKQSKFWGRTLGNVYALVSIAGSVALMMVVKGDDGFRLGTVLFFLYPVLTLILLNTTFKEDFERVSDDP